MSSSPTPPTRVASPSGRRASSAVRWTAPVPPQVGDRCLTSRRIGLADRPVTSELVHFDPPHQWGVRGMDGPIRATVEVIVEPRPDTSADLTIALDFQGHGIGRLLVPLLVRREARRETPVNVMTMK